MGRRKRDKLDLIIENIDSDADREELAKLLGVSVKQVRKGEHIGGEDKKERPNPSSRRGVSFHGASRTDRRN
jgi:hypothetical protein